MAAATFEEHQQVLALFAQGIAGRYFHLKAIADEDPDHQQTPAHSDGNVIFVPASVERYRQARQNLGFYRIAILHQIGFYEFGTFNFRYPQASASIPELRKYPQRTPLLPTATHFEQFFAHFEQSNLIRTLFNLSEDWRIDCALLRCYPGIAPDLTRAREAQHDRLFGSDSQQPLVALRLLSLGVPANVLPAIPTQVAQAFLQLEGTDASVYDSARAATIAYTLAASRLEPISASELAELLGEEGHQGELQPDLVQRRLRHDAMQDILDAEDATWDETEEEPGGEGPPPANLDGANISPGDVENGVHVTLENARRDAFEQLQENDGDSADLSRRMESDRSALRLGFGEVSRPGRSYFYDEWDYLRGSYRRKYCRLFEERVSGDASVFLADVLTRHRDQLSSIRRSFEQLRALSMLAIRGLTDGEDIDLDKAIARHADLVAGHPPDERVYVQRQPRRRDVAAAFLLDVSASTDTPIPDPDAPTESYADYDEDDYLHDVGSYAEPDDAEAPRTVLDVQKEALTLIALALQAIGDEFAVYGFSGYGREEVEFFVAKHFEDPPGARTWRGIAGMKPRRSTRMGPAIRHAVSRLNDQDAALRILIILSDGFPQDHDYGPDRTDHTYGIRDTEKALEEANLSGVETFCITVDRAGHDYLRNMCSEDRYLVIDEIESLVNVLPKVYSALAT